jgi:hypothetical protein
MSMPYSKILEAGTRWTAIAWWRHATPNSHLYYAVVGFCSEPTEVEAFEAVKGQIGQAASIENLEVFKVTTERLLYNIQV